MKPAISDNHTTALYGSIATRPNNPTTRADSRKTDIAVLRRPRRSDSSLPRRPAGTPRKPISAPTASMLQHSAAASPWPVAQKARNTTIHCRIAEDQDNSIAIADHRPDLEHRPPPFDDCDIRPRQRRPCDRHAGGTENAGQNECA